MLRLRNPEPAAQTTSTGPGLNLFIILAVALIAAVGCDNAGGGGAGGEGNGGKTPEKEAQTAPAEGTGVPEVIGAPAIADPAQGQPGSEERAKAFTEAAAKKVAEKPNVRGDDPKWFFLVRELKQMALGKFWEKDWAEVAQNQTDPIPSMVEFHDLLKAKGVELIIVPVPAKASIYPDKLDARFATGDPWPLTPLIEKMKAAGLNAVDLEPVMRQRREAQPDEKLWCAQDAHYSPLACEIVAGLVKAELEKGDWFAAQAKEELKRTDPTDLEIVGDQVKGSEWEGQVAKETLKVRYAGREKDGRIDPLAPNPDSPVLLLGDSHTLVFQEGASGGMHCKGAGLFDQLSFQCGFPLDLIGVRGSGLVQARKTLAYTAMPVEGYWDKKKAVVWVFSVREFTQSFDKIIPIPIEKP